MGLWGLVGGAGAGRGGGGVGQDGGIDNSKNGIMDAAGANKEQKNEGGGQEDVSLSASQWANVSHPVADAHKHIHDTTDKVPQAMEGTLAAVAASIMYTASGMSRWGIAEATLGLYKLHCRHVREGVIDTINGTLVTSVTEMQEVAHWIKWAAAAYEEKIKPCALVLEVQEDCIVKLVTASAVGKPAFLIGLDHSKKAVVLSIRGTFSALDVLTDLKPHCEHFENGYAHSGMLNSAQWLQDNVSDVLKDLMANQGYRLVVTGHSLGAGTAALLSMLLRETNEKGLTVLGSKPEAVTCWGFCCPPCVDKKLAEETTFIRCVIHQDDIVARISPSAVEDLRTEILQTHWGHALDDGTKKKTMMEVAQNSISLLDQIEPALNFQKDELVQKVKQQGFATMKELTNSLTFGWTKVTEGEYGAGAKHAASLLTMGAFAAGTTGKKVAGNMNEAIVKEMQLIEYDSRKGASLTASSMAASAEAASMREGSEFLERNKLFVPGILYHVIRRPLQTAETLPDGLPVGVGTSKGAEKDAPMYRHIIVRGDDPSSRFERIVLSNSFIADHLCPGLQDAVADAMKWQNSGKPI